MERTTIDYGIDLGTTNSSIAVLSGITTEVFKNNEGQEITPSAVWIDSKGRLAVGRLAKQRLGYDEENAKAEFKLLMGESHIYTFAECNRQMTPEELSAEILKSLRGDVQVHTGEEIISAAIGVPAAFELPACKATDKAARLAGLSYSPLIQEPIAAAMAYGFQSESDRIFWLVYDFGGGTFDVAIIQVRDGLIQLVNHGGNKGLGGKDIDWAIVSELLVPAVKKEYKLTDFSRDNPKWIATFAKLKEKAEEAKIRLSRDTVAPITIDSLFKDERDQEVRFEYELKRSDIEPLIEPYVDKTLSICKKILGEKRLASSDIEKIILVGGPTLTPLVREILSDKLGIPLEFRMDPLAVVARGTAIFAGTQRIPEDIRQLPSVLKGQYKVELEYEPIGSDLAPPVGGKVIASEGESLAGFMIEFIESKSKWRSGLIVINDNGTFMTTVRAEKGRSNEFSIELRDNAGNLRETVPDRFIYTTGISISGQPLINSVGVGLASGEMQIFLSKGTPLPARQRKLHYSTVGVKKRESGTFLRIPVVEGENIRRADRNPKIGEIEVSGENIKRDVPVGTEVEITIIIDESRLVTAKAYVPILDEEYEDVAELGKTITDPKQLAKELKQEKDRLEKVREKAQKAGAFQAEETLQRIQNERMVHEVENSLTAASVDADAACKCQQRLLDLKSSIDEAEDILEWPALVSETKEWLEATREIVDKYGQEEAQRNFKSLEDETGKAIAAHDVDLLCRKEAELHDLGMRILAEYPGYWVELFGRLVEERKSHMSDQDLAEQLIAQGRRAIDAQDMNVLVAVVRQLFDLLPAAEQREVGGYGGTTMPI